MIELTLYLVVLMALCIVAFGGWFLSLQLKNVAIVDSLWSLFIAMAGLGYFYLTNAFANGYVLVTAVLLALWALRLSFYISWRNWGKGEDHRYQTIRKNNQPYFTLKSLYIVFGLQAGLASVVALCFLPVATAQTAPHHWGFCLGVFVVVFGALYEAVADWQLHQFLRKKENKNKVMDQGLWRLSRHPNYFGEFCVWWGFYVIALSFEGWWAVVSPLLMTVLLLKVSGVRLLEKTITTSRPKYADYIKQTNAFFPGRRKGT